MDFNKERENNIIKNIAKEIVFECAQRGLEVSQELANYVVKLTLLNPENGYSASEVMPRNLTQQMVLMVIEELKKDTPAMNCIRMQVYWDSVKLNVAEMKKEYQSTVAEKAEPHLNEILALEKEDSKRLLKHLACYVMVTQNMGSINNHIYLKETMAAIQSVFRRKEAVEFFQDTEEQKTETAKVLALRTTGIRLYLKHCGKSGEGMGDVKRLSLKVEELKEEMVGVIKKIGTRIDDIREVISNVIPMDYFLLDPFQTADVFLPTGSDMSELSECMKILAIMLQQNFYMNDLQSILEEIDGNSLFYIAEQEGLLAELHTAIKGRETVPTFEVYDFFDRLGKVWSEIQCYFYCLEQVQNVMEDFGKFNKEEYFVQSELEKAVLIPLKIVLDARQKSLDSAKSTPHMSSVILQDDEECTLEFNGFCAWTLYYTSGLLVPGNPHVEAFKHRGLYYSFASENGRELWMKEPEYYLMQVYGHVRINTELVGLLNLYEALYRTKSVQMTKVVERKVAIREEGIQTVVHPIEKHWDKDYTFSIWELKKRALTLSRLVKCVTKSVQTVSPHSHFRASIGLTAAPDKDKQVQTKRDSSCVHPTIANYLYGLRGHLEDKFRVIDLTRPIDDSSQGQTVTEERPPCKERRQPKEMRPLQPLHSEPCRTTSSSDKCDYYYAYDSNDSNDSNRSEESRESRESRGSNYYFRYNGEG